MKKIIAAVVAATAFCLGATAVFAGCGGNRAGGENSLVYNVRYIAESKIHSDDKAERSYYIFYSNGMGKYYRAWYKTNNNLYMETITFKYIFFGDDKADILCLFHSVERGYVGEEMSTESTKQDREWDETIEASEKAIMTVGTYGYTCWINENYVKDYPNYQLNV